MAQARTGRTGADGVYKSVHRICQILIKYQVKLVAVIATMTELELLTAAQAATATTFIQGAQAACAVFEVIAHYAGFATDPE
jgi:hypothetical protein